MSEDGAERPWLAALLSLGYPGLGHLWLGLWGRAVLWAGIAALTATVLAPEDPLALALAHGPAGLLGRVSATTAFMLATVRTMAAVDAAWHVLAGRTGDDEGTCPDCGRRVDPELSFCPWCSADLEAVSAR